MPTITSHLFWYLISVTLKANYCIPYQAIISGFESISMYSNNNLINADLFLVYLIIEYTNIIIGILIISIIISHLWTVIIAFSGKRWLRALVTLMLPVLAEIYWIILLKGKNNLYVNIVAIQFALFLPISILFIGELYFLKSFSLVY